MTSGSTLLVHDAEHIVSMARDETDFGPGDILIRDGLIVDLFRPDDADRPGRENVDRAISAKGKVVFPGLVNTHHHFFQALTRNLPASHMSPLFDWLVEHYRVWAHLRGEMVEAATQVVLAELLLTGCTTTADHHYLFPAGERGAEIGLLDRQIRAAASLGIRFHPTRGSMELGQARGGLPPDDLVETGKAILADSTRVIEAHHDPARLAMCRVALSPCAPFNVSEALMRDTAALARRHGVRLHTHLAESADETAFCLSRYGCRPLEYARRLGWIGNDVWLAHAVHLTDDEIEELAREGVGVAHCPSSNLRLGSGTAPVRRLLDAGVSVSIGVDGCASNDSSNALGELRQSLLVQRTKTKDHWIGPREVFRMATRGGAAVLGRDDVGQLAPGFAADLVIVDLDQACYAGGKADPLAALVFNESLRPVDTVLVNGRVVVSQGELVTANERDLAARVHDCAAELRKAAGLTDTPAGGPSA